MLIEKKTAKAIVRVAELMYDKEGVQGVQDFADVLKITKRGKCKPCENEVPIFLGNCLVCGTPIYETAIVSEDRKECKLIADFLGWEETHEESEQYCLTYEIKGLEVGDCNIFSLEEFLFKEDWNWLMKLVDKIEDTSINDNDINVTIGSGNYCVIQDSHGELVEINVYASSKILTVYANCVEFIKWYNEFYLK